MDIIRLVLHRIDNAPAGGTLSLAGSGHPTHGYMVGGAGPTLVFQSEDMLREHWGSVESYASAMIAHGHQFLGWWTDPETSRVHLDVATWHPDMFQADQQAMRRGEIAFYDIERGADVKTGSTGVGEAV